MDVLQKEVIIRVPINASYLQLYLKMSFFDNVSENTTNVEQLFYKT